MLGAILRTPSQTSQQYDNARKLTLWNDAPDPVSLRSASHGVHVFTTTESCKDEIALKGELTFSPRLLWMQIDN